jgi:hypothetical protein
MDLSTKRQHARHTSDPSADTALLIELNSIESSGSAELGTTDEDQPYRHESAPYKENASADINVPVRPEGFKPIANLYIRRSEIRYLANHVVDLSSASQVLYHNQHLSLPPEHHPKIVPVSWYPNGHGSLCPHA